MTQLVSQLAVLRGAVDSVAANLPALVDVVESELAKIKGERPHGTHAG